MNVEEPQEPEIPVTILTGFLGAGKTTLLNRILKENHNHKIAIIENEFGTENVDNDLLVTENNEQIVSMNNGCVCCTIRGDLSRILTKLRLQRDKGEIDFDYIVLETSGVANPGPVAQTFFMDDAIAPFFRLDGVVTVVDAKYGPKTLDDEAAARDQVGFADRILVSKCDLVTPDVDPNFFVNDHHLHHHNDDIHTFVYETETPFDPQKLDRYIGSLTAVYGQDMLRYKGILYFAGVDRRVVFQGVHMLAVSDVMGPWGDVKPFSKLVFIGRNLPEEAIARGLDTCLAKA